MESEKVKEIKKALEQNDDNGIMYEVNDEKRTCKFIHHKDILTLINELESENDCKDIEISKQEYQIEKLKDRIAELEKENEILKGTKDRLTFADRINLVDNAVEIKLKQFADRLKEKLFDLGNIVNENDIDETLKVFIK